MSLTQKVFLAFILMIVMSVIIGAMGYRSISLLSGTVDNTVKWINPVDRLLTEMRTGIDKCMVAQRTLLSPRLPMAEREKAHLDYDKAWEDVQVAMQGCSEKIEAGAGSIEGWVEVSRLVAEAKPKLDAFAESGWEISDCFREWENTFILNPALLVANLQQYRGDHYDLLRRMALLIMAGADDGLGQVSADDTRCAFGRWRQSFDSGGELYAQNPIFRQAMDKMRQPHQRFHALARDIQREVLSGEMSVDRSKVMFSEMNAAAREVIDTFSIMTEESIRADRLASRAQDGILTGITAIQNEALYALDAVAQKNRTIAEQADDAAVVEGRERTKTIGVMTISLVVVGFLLALMVAWCLKKELTRPLRRVITALSAESENLHGTAGRMTHLSSELADGSNNQASSLEETSAAMEQMASMTRQNADNARNANRLMGKTAASVRDGSEAIVAMNRAMSDINDSTERIGNIFKAIENIAFQTNLLALNAAVEAARAGEAGKGFAVVADEVRSLAQNSAAAARDTVMLITGMIERVQTGSRVAVNMNHIFNEIAGSTMDIERMMSEIAAASDEQARGVDQVNSAISRIDKITQTIASQADGTSESSSEIVNQVESIRAAILELKRILGGGADSPGRIPSLPVVHALPLPPLRALPHSSTGGGREIELHAFSADLKS